MWSNSLGWGCWGGRGDTEDDIESGHREGVWSRKRPCGCFRSWGFAGAVSRCVSMCTQAGCVCICNCECVPLYVCVLVQVFACLPV